MNNIKDALSILKEAEKQLKSQIEFLQCVDSTVTMNAKKFSSVYLDKLDACLNDSIWIIERELNKDQTENEEFEMTSIEDLKSTLQMCPNCHVYIDKHVRNCPICNYGFPPIHMVEKEELTMKE